jgi:2-polyprenyl-3-methyl-5-hydroxy-6-metoxy-1,4-benzoquinol methylase
VTKDAERLRKTWETWAADDPLFAILSDPTKLGGKWDIEEFMAHTPELDDVFALVEKYDLLAGHSRALDFGCGVGRITQALAKRFDSVFGIDISESMVAKAKQLNEHGDRVRYVTGDLSVLSGRKFDFIFSVYVIQHVPRSMQRDVLRSLVGLLTPDGLLAIQISPPSGVLKRIRAQVVPRWIKERSFKRRFKGAPLIEMNPLSHDEVARAIAPATIRLVHDEWFFVQPA